MRQRIAILILLALFITPVFSQTPAEKVEKLPPKLLDLIKVLVEYQKTGQWEKIYEMDYRKNMTKEAFLQLYTKGPGEKTQTGFLDFVPRYAFFTPQTREWMVIGCGDYREKEGVARHKSSLHAVEKEKELYLSPVQRMLGPASDCQDKKE